MEVRQLFETCSMVWGEGGQASLFLYTLEGRARAMLDLQLDHTVAPCPGAPYVRGEGPGQPGPLTNNKTIHLHRDISGGAADVLRCAADKTPFIHLNS